MGLWMAVGSVPALHSCCTASAALHQLKWESPNHPHPHRFLSQPLFHFKQKNTALGIPPLVQSRSLLPPTVRASLHIYPHGGKPARTLGSVSLKLSGSCLMKHLVLAKTGFSQVMKVQEGENGVLILGPAPGSLWQSNVGFELWVGLQSGRSITAIIQVQKVPQTIT